jgi:hypothetical protein
MQGKANTEIDILRIYLFCVLYAVWTSKSKDTLKGETQADGS